MLPRTTTLLHNAGDPPLARFAKLQEVALRLPAIHVDVTIIDTSYEPFGRALIALSSLPLLRRVAIVDWPLAPAGFFPNAYTAEQDSEELKQVRLNRYLEMLDALATKIFRAISALGATNRAARWDFLSFGADHAKNIYTTDMRYNVRESSYPVYYVPERHFDKEGEEHVVAIRRSLEEMVYMEGEWDGNTFTREWFNGELFRW